MPIETSIPLLDEILEQHRDAIAADYAAYRNHVYRMVNFCFALRDCNADERRKVIVAGCFHDIGIWTAKTFDYLPPSMAAARTYLAGTDFEAWTTEIELMIDMHHKLRSYKDPRCPLVEVFRRGDLADFSLGLVKAGVPSDVVREAKREFANAGFHKRVVGLEARWLVRHPLRAVPVLKW